MTTELQRKEQQNPATREEQERFRKPYYEVEEHADAHHVFVYMPGVDKKATEISVDHDILTIIGHRTDRTPETWRPIHRELSDRNFRLQLRLNVAIDENKIAAKADAGVVTVTLPVAEEAKPRSIPVS